MAFYNTRKKCSFNNDSDLWLKSTSLGGRPARRSAGRVLEELELKPTQPQTEVGLGLGFGLSLAKIIMMLLFKRFAECNRRSPKKFRSCTKHNLHKIRLNVLHDHIKLCWMLQKWFVCSLGSNF